MIRELALLAGLSVAILSTPAMAGGITGIVAFGDSLSDTGNTYLAAGIPNSPPYFNGHYSNGPIWLEYLAGQLGIAAPTPSFAGGTDNAWGGAETGGGLSFMNTPNIGSQVQGFLSTNTIGPNQLVTVWGGANDFLNAGVINPMVPVTNIAAAITALAAAGGHQFMVPNLPLLGELPATNGLPQPQRDALDQLTFAFNGLLAARLAQLEGSLGVTIHQLDVNGVFEKIIADPAAYGLTNVTTSALGDGVLSGQGYLFWDTVHPTTQVQELIGREAAGLVPEPSSLLLMVLAAPVFLVWRRFGRTIS
jgi:phospholipase/lecithinase/hemolysin